MSSLAETKNGRLFSASEVLSEKPRGPRVLVKEMRRILKSGVSHPDRVVEFKSYFLSWLRDASLVLLCRRPSDSRGLSIISITHKFLEKDLQARMVWNNRLSDEQISLLDLQEHSDTGLSLRKVVKMMPGTLLMKGLECSRIPKMVKVLSPGNVKEESRLEGEVYGWGKRAEEGQAEFGAACFLVSQEGFGTGGREIGLFFRGEGLTFRSADTPRKEVIDSFLGKSKVISMWRIAEG